MAADTENMGGFLFLYGFEKLIFGRLYQLPYDPKEMLF